MATGDKSTDAYQGDGTYGLGKLLSGLGASYRDTKGNESRTTDTTDKTVQDFTQHIDHILAEDVITSRLRDEDKYLLYDTLKRSMDDYLNSQYLKDDARADSATARDRAFYDYETQSLPRLYGQVCSSGLYNSSTEQLLADDAYARTVKVAAELELDTINKYKQLHLKEGELNQGYLRLLLDSYQYVDRDLDEDTDRKEKTTINRTISEKMNRDYSESVAPNMTEFLKDSAILTVVLGVLGWVAKRQYFTEQTG